MGIYLPNMNMPISCHVCVAAFGGCCYVAPSSSDGICPDSSRPEWCPLVHVQPHGRLIDADALKLSHCKECTLYPDKCLEKTDKGCDCGSIYHIEHCAPTIIEAEEGNE